MSRKVRDQMLSKVRQNHREEFRILHVVESLPQTSAVTPMSLARTCLHYDETVSFLESTLIVEHFHKPKTKFEIELPSRIILRIVTIFVCECDTNLNELKELNIASHCLIMIIRGCFKCSNGTRYYPRKLGILTCMNLV